MSCSPLCTIGRFRMSCCLKLQRECYWRFYRRPESGFYLLTRKLTNLAECEEAGAGSDEAGDGPKGRVSVNWYCDRAIESSISGRACGLLPATGRASIGNIFHGHRT